MAKGKGLSPQRDAFARFYIELSDASKAYRKAYPRSQKWKPEAVWSQASRLLADPKVAARVEALQERHAKRHEITVESLVMELEEARAAAMDRDPSRSAAVAATMGKAKLLGLIIDKSKVEGSVTVQQLPPLSPKAALAVMAKLESEKF